MRAARTGLLIALLITFLPMSGEAAFAKSEQQPLTPQFYRRNCMMCHKTAVPEGLDPAIVAGVRPAHPTRSRDVMPNVRCWRRCRTCWPSSARPHR